MSQWPFHSVVKDTATLQSRRRTQDPASSVNLRAPRTGTTVKSLGVTCVFFGMLFIVGAVAAVSSERGIRHAPAWRGGLIFLLGSSVLALGIWLLRRAARSANNR